MTSPIAAISPFAGVPAVAPINTDLVAADPAAGADFAAKLAQGLGHVQELQQTTAEMQVQAATGTLNDVHDYMIASSESGLATSLTVAVRNKAVEAFQEIMRMQA